ncbi:hypothetical protein BaRGS_00034068 [Batillaria attramentaria]|uniref:Uncharacterized protein n=1 Tax=Batillaria attramentaria TaxID=370345 RepID=A0ABD0JIY3_9CAEN
MSLLKYVSSIFPEQHRPKATPLISLRSERRLSPVVHRFVEAPRQGETEIPGLLTPEARPDASSDENDEGQPHEDGHENTQESAVQPEPAQLNQGEGRRRDCHTNACVGR